MRPANNKTVIEKVFLKGERVVFSFASINRFVGGSKMDEIVRKHNPAKYDEVKKTNNPENKKLIPNIQLKKRYTYFILFPLYLFFISHTTRY